MGVINNTNTQIATAAEAQSAVARGIDCNATNMHEVANKTAGGAAQTAAASEELARLANDMQQLVAHFKL